MFYLTLFDFILYYILTLLFLYSIFIFRILSYEQKTKTIDPYIGFANTIKNATDSLAKMIDQLLKLIRPLLMDAFDYLIKIIHEMTKGFMKSKFAKDMGLDFSNLSMLMEEVLHQSM